MTAPSPALRQLYRQAATPARWLATLRKADALIERFEFDLRRAGLDAEIPLAALLTPVSLDAALGGVRLTSNGAPAGAGAGLPDQMDALPHRPRAGLDKLAERPDRFPAPLRPGTASIETTPTHAARSNHPPEADRHFDPSSHPRLALLQTLARVDLPSLQRRYGLIDSADAGAATTTRPPGRTASAALAPQHSAADAQAWLHTLARRADAPGAANQPMALRAPQAGHDPDLPSRPINASGDIARAAGNPRALPASTSVAQRPAHTRTDHPTAEPFDNNPSALGSLQRLLQRFDPARPTPPSATSASAAAGSPWSALRAEPARPAGITTTADTTADTTANTAADTAAGATDSRHPAAAAAAALRTELRRSTPPPQGSPAETPLDPARTQVRTAPATRTASPGPTWATPIGGFRGLAALGRTAESAAAPAPADTPAPRQPFGANADALRDGIDAEQLAELLRQQARRHGIDLTEFEP